MPQMTITEALADIKTTTARIQKKRESIMRYFARDSKLVDPLQDSGGSQQFIANERQAIGDLETKIIRIRAAIQNANLNTNLTMGEKTMSVAEWLNWRREVSNGQKNFLQQMANMTSNLRQQAIKQGLQVTNKEGYNPENFIINVPETELAQEIDSFEQLLGTLDGKLSLLNATTTIDV